MKLTREEAAATIEAFVDETGGRWDWDAFISIPLADPELERVRIRCAGLPEEFPPTGPHQYCGPEGLAVLSSIIRELRMAL